MGAGGGFLEHGLPGADRQSQADTGGSMEAHLLRVQAAKRGRVHTVQQAQLLHRIPRHMRPAGGLVHEDGTGEAAGQERQHSGPRQAGSLLRRAHASRCIAPSQPETHRECLRLPVLHALY